MQPQPKLSESPLTDRRRFLAGGVSLFSALSLAPRSARAALGQEPQAEGDERTLVVVQLSGGNDGLSTVVPFADDVYHKSRRATRIDAKDVLKLDDYCGLHPNLAGLRRAWEAGRLAIVESVGAPGQGRSHFKQLEVWHAAAEQGRAGGEGWLARLCAQAWPGATQPELMVHVGEKVPYSLYSAERRPVAFEAAESYRWMGEAEEQKAYRRAAQRATEEVHDAARTSSVLERLRAVHLDAQESSARIRQAAARYRPSVRYPSNDFGAGLRTIAALIDARLGARVLSIELGGFDTHGNQRGAHNDLMRTLDEGMTAFLTDLHGRSAASSTLVLAFSEFGRRVEENGSSGTDHGKGGPMFAFGDPVRGGFFGQRASLTALDQGDLAVTTDFRSVYATAVESWFGAPQEPVLGARFEPVPYLRRGA